MDLVGGEVGDLLLNPPHPPSEARKFTTFSAETRVTLGDQPWGFLGGWGTDITWEKGRPSGHPFEKGDWSPSESPPKSIEIMAIEFNNTLTLSLT